MAQENQPSEGRKSNSGSREAKPDAENLQGVDLGASKAADLQVSAAAPAAFASLTGYLKTGEGPMQKSVVEDAASETAHAPALAQEIEASPITTALSGPSDQEALLASASNALDLASEVAPGKPAAPTSMSGVQDTALRAPAVSALPSDTIAQSASFPPAAPVESVPTAAVVQGGNEDIREAETFRSFSSQMVENSPDGATVIVLPEVGQYGDQISYSFTDAAGNPVSPADLQLVGNEVQVAPGGVLDFEKAETQVLYVTATTPAGVSSPWPITLAVSDAAEALVLKDGGVGFTDTGVAESSITGGAGDDAITGHNAGAVLDGAGGSDQLTGGTSGDILTGGLGDDTLDGSAGSDVAVFSGNWSDYTITEAGGVYTVIDDRLDSPDGTDILINIEVLRFADGDRSAADALNDAPELTVADASVTENTAGASVTMLQSTDADAGDKATLTVDDARFEIVNGHLKLRDDVSLDYEADGPSVAVTVTATDSHGAKDTQVVTVTIDDAGEALVLDDGGAGFTDTGVTETSITGGSGDDTITGNTGGAVIDGASGDDFLTGNAGDDSLTGGAGDDMLDGGAGDDVAFFTSAWADYQITEADGVYTVTDLRPGSPDGTATLSNVETLDFADGSLPIAEALNNAPELQAESGAIAENDAGAAVGTVVATDANAGDNITLSVDDARFEFADGQLKLRDGVNLDYEADGSSIAVTIIATDSHGATDTEVVTVAITDTGEALVLDDGGVAFTDNGVTETSITGGEGDDTITGHTDGGFLAGAAGNDALTGGAGNDSLEGGTGDDTLEGGTGSDTAVWEGDLADFSVSYDSGTDTFTVVDGNAADGADEATDTVTGVESFTFNSMTYTAAEMQTEAARQANTGPGGVGVANGCSVDENSGAGTVVATLTATDTDGDALTYTITDVDGNLVADRNFEIIGNEIRVLDNADLNYEVATSHSLYITASDAFETSAPQAITVTVSDVAETIVLDNGGDSFADDGVAETSITGGSSNDKIIAHEDGGEVDGGGGNDYIEGGIGDDTLSGGAGDDMVSSGGSDDTILGGTGNDTLNGQSGNDQIDGGDGYDELTGEAGDDTFTGGAGDDVIGGGDGSDTAVFQGDLSDFSVRYEAGTKTFKISDLNARDGDEGTDLVTGVETFAFNGTPYTLDQMITEADRQANTGPGSPSVASGGDVFENSAAGTVVATLTATDADGDALTYTITEADGNPVSDRNFEVVGNEVRVRDGTNLDYESDASHQLYVTASDAFETSSPQGITVTVNDVAEAIVLGEGGESFTDAGVTETSVLGGDGADLIQGSSGDDQIDGSAGDDVISGKNGADLLNGGTGNDGINGGAGDDTLKGEKGDDTLRGNGDTDTAIYDGDLSDFSIAYGGNNDFTITDLNAGDGDEGIDTVTEVEVFEFNGVTYTAAELQTEAARQANSGPGNPSVASGGAVDENSVAGSVVATLTATDIDGDALTYTITDVDGNTVTDSNFEIVGNEIRLRNSADLDYETATSHGLYVTASDAFETSSPLAVTVTVNDVAENILLDDGGVSFTDADVAETSITGGAGNDTITGHNDGARIDGAAGDDVIMGGAGNDALTGGAGNDTLVGTAGDNTLEGGDGNDIAVGGGAADTVSGGAGNDIVAGLDGTDSLSGGSGDDTLYGASGDDGLDGGSGVDIAYFTGNWADYAITEADGFYTVTDLRPGSPEGTDTITNVELFRFADGNVTPADALNDGPILTISGGQVTENEAGAVIGAVSASDPDAGDTVTLSVDDPRFEVAGGQLRLRDGESLDHEAGETLTVTVTATDAGGLSDSQTVTVSVGDTAEDLTLDDAGAAFIDQGVAETSITGGAGDDTITGHNDGARIDGAAGDDVIMGGAGNDTIDGGLGEADKAVLSGDLDDFSVSYNSGTGTFSIADGNATDGLDEGTDAVTGVEAFEFNGVTYTAAEMITEAARQANEAPTQVSFASGGSVNETVADGGTIARGYDPSGATVATLTTSDADRGDSHTYTLVNDASGKFEIVGDEVRVKAGQTVDYETDTSFDLTIRTTDEFGEIHDEVLTLNVTDFEGGYKADDSGEAITGTSEEDMIYGSAGADTIDGGAGDDVIAGGGSPDIDALVLLNFDDGGAVASDTSGNNRDGALKGDAVDGGIGWNGEGTGILLDGDGDYVEIPTDPAFELAAGTVSVRFNADSLSENQAIFSRDSMNFDGGGHLTTVLRSDGSIEVRLQSASGNTYMYSEAGSVAAGEWSHIAVSFGPDGAQLFLNGVSVDTDSYTGGINGNSEPWTLGASQNRSSDGVADNLNSYFTGTIDEFAVFDSQFTTAQIAEIEASGIVVAPDELSGGEGNDQVTGGTGADIIYGGAGNDTVDGGAGNDSINGGAGNDSIDGEYGDDWILGGSGADTLSAGAGDDVVFGEDGNDSLYGGDGSDTLDGGAGDDVVSAGGGSDMIYGGTGSDWLSGGDGSDTFIVTALEGSDSIDGGSGWTDAIELAGFSGAVNVTRTTADGEGWTMVLESGHFATAQTLDSLELTVDSVGVITFDDGGTIDFSGIERINF